jgi:hypothetical protein
MARRTKFVPPAKSRKVEMLVSCCRSYFISMFGGDVVPTTHYSERNGLFGCKKRRTSDG